MFACYDLCAVLTPCGPLKYLIGLIQDKQAPLPGLLYEAEVRDGVTHAEHRQQRQEQRQQQQPRRTKSTSRNDESASRSDVHRTSSSHTSHTSHSSSHGPRANNTAAMPPPMAAPVVAAPPMAGPPMAVAIPANIDAASVPVLSERPRNVAESNFSTYDCETMEELVSLLSVFYETFSPEDVWKAPQVAEKFFPTQDRLWLLIFHKYTVCTCSMDIPCPVQVRQDRRRRAREEEEEEDKTIKLGLGDFIFYSVLVGRAAIEDFSTFAVAFLCIVMVRWYRVCVCVFRMVASVY
jgi:presenilin 1